MQIAEGRSDNSLQETFLCIDYNYMRLKVPEGAPKDTDSWSLQ